MTDRRELERLAELIRKTGRTVEWALDSEGRIEYVYVNGNGLSALGFAEWARGMLRTH